MQQRNERNIFAMGLARSGWMVALGLTLLASCASTDTGEGREHFASPEAAGSALADALARKDADAVRELLGEDWGDLLPNDVVRSDAAEAFTDAWSDFHGFEAVDGRTYLLQVGSKGWTFPAPIVGSDGDWWFDSETGADVVWERRIGRNELAVIQTALAYHDAQMEYALVDRNGNGTREYAQKLMSSPGQRDGLCWETADGELESPLGPLVADNTPDGAYHGYRFRILTAQGKRAKDGARDYVENGRMVSGFALLAWPSEYGETGIMSFQISREGTVFESDLGEDTERRAASIHKFDPGSKWSPVDAEYVTAQD